MIKSLLAVLFLLAAPAAAHGSTITVQANELGNTGTSLPFTYLVNVDNTRDPHAASVLDRTGVAPTESNSPIVAEGDQTSNTTPDLAPGRYLVSVRSPDHKLWGKHVTVPATGNTDVTVSLRKTPLPLGKIRVFVFADNAWTNGAPDTEEGGLEGFHVTLEEQTNSQVSVDYFNHPLCGGTCLTENDGFVQIDNLGPATYFIYVTAPDTPCNSDDPSSRWTQTTTIDGGLGLQAGVEENSDGTGAPGEQLWEPPNRRTAYWFGFVCSSMGFASSGSGAVTGRALNWVGWPPFDVLVPDPTEPVRNPYIALSDSSTDRTVYVGHGDGDGNFTVPDVPPGTYNVAIWDEQLSYIIRFLPVTVAAGEHVDLGDVGVSRWFGWLDGDVFLDTNKNGQRDPGEPGIGNTDVDQRWRDGSIKETTFTDSTGHYEYPTAEGGPLGKWIIGEQGFARFSAFPGAFVHDEYDPDIVRHVPTDLGGALLTNQLITEGHRATVDWGKQQYAAGKPGQIVGVTYFATTRNEFDARFQAHETYEPGIPDITVRLEAQDGTVLNEYVTDHWHQPSDGDGQSCDVLDSLGADLSGELNPLVGPHCVEVPLTGAETKDGAFDGGYAFADYCPASRGGFGHFDDNGDTVCEDGLGPQELVAGTYVTHVLMPHDVDGHALYHIVREEDVNVDLGADFVPAIPPPPCAGDMHTVHIDPDVMPRGSPYDGKDMPLCDKRLVVLQNNQNANADFFMQTNFANGEDVAEPGRIVGLVGDDIYFDTDKHSIWFGEPRPLANIPIGIRDYAMRLLTTVDTSENGAYEALLPSTETFNCPIPQGPCPGMYVVVVNDPGDKDHPNPNYNPNYLTASSAWDVWPGQTDQLDTPLDPISGTGCEPATGTPELLQVDKPGRALGEQGPFVRSSDTTAANRRITLHGVNFGAIGTGANAGRITLTDSRGALQSRTFTGLATAAQLSSVNTGGIVSWNDTTIVLQVPAAQTLLFPAGPRQLMIKKQGAAGLTTANGITAHVLGSGYDPPVVKVPPATADGTQLQTAINAAAANSLVVLGEGTYRENVLMWKPLKLQGLGVGGAVGTVEPGGPPAEDPRFLVNGSAINGAFFQDNQASWDGALSAAGAMTGVNADHPVLKGAALTVAASISTGAYPSGMNAARIDGIGISNGHGEGAGGIQLQAGASNLQLSNDVLEHNGGVFAGGIGLGQPYYDTNNQNVKVLYDRVLGNGGLTRSGGLGIFRSSNNYEVANSVVCSNFGVEYGAGISHWGRSPGGSIHDNQIYYNESVDSGAGISISEETPLPVDGQPVLGTGSGAVDVDRNRIQSNYSGDDGGAMFVMNAQGARINIRTNTIAANGAADIGGAVMLDDSTNVAIVNNTIANNVSTASSETSDGSRHSAGLASEANDPLYQASIPNGPRFSRPVALFNNIFWNNQAFTLSQPGPGATLVSQGFLDFEVHGTLDATDRFAPRYSLMTNGDQLAGDGSLATIPGGGAPILGFPANAAQNGNVTGVDPGFVTPVTLELTVTGSRLDPQVAAVTLTGADPPVGLPGDYHLQPALLANQTSGAVDRGVHCSNTPVPPPANPLGACPAGGIEAPVLGTDIDGQLRPQLRTLRARTPWDLGADERPTVG
ncbi:SdrD B-like domain-containing protein [Candidatus Solirubrobacter pratensis]|uniref:SdrD B-like domain-containing protein n=1 Tax=Candidatus Solirubrobacter pratensis TaxID=1298857 RepID=UPI0004872AE4|nr:SdrD B-like domain-containing protein [Candidatus Solirubrobacter pratensis]